ncbi:transporter [Desulfosarcina alkanivorans]|uniref:Transporter n=1 Tax=Desulfosarcina alkanivorans TaxID=571177 RepID=A0A5K7YQQ4_9BACT|nr:DMT family transporter [Desulfosarcina alkanivorans]BBO70655.1 transporter [Desulfosarcina alkanivorans]
MPQPAPSRQVKLDAAVAGPLFMLAAALLFTLLNLIVKQIGPAYTIWHIGFYRFFGGVVVLLLIFGRHGNAYRGHNTRLLIIRGFTGSAAFLCVVTAIRLLPVSTALVIFYAFPAFSAVFARLIYGERISREGIGCIVMVIVGIGVLFDFSLSGNLAGQAMALAGSAFAGLTVTLIKTLREKNGPVIIYLYFCTMGMLVTLPQFAMAPLIPATAMDWAMVLGIVFSSVVAQLSMNQGFFYCRGWEGGVFMSSEVIFTAIVGIAFLGDPASWRFWTGGLLIVGSAVALNRFKANHARSEK